MRSPIPNLTSPEEDCPCYLAGDTGSYQTAFSKGAALCSLPKETDIQAKPFRIRIGNNVCPSNFRMNF